MKCRVIGTDQPEIWNDALKRLPEGDIYFYPEYHRAYELNGDGKACAFISEEGADLLFHPFFLRPIKEAGGAQLEGSWYDVESVYGYSGPLCTPSATSNTAFLHEAWSAFGSWCRESRVIAEFVRFNPLLENFRYARDAYDLTLDRETVVVKLDKSKAVLWDSYPPANRTKVRKALKNGLTSEEVDLSQGLDTFKRLYRKTMDHLGAQAFYFFSDDYFEYLRASLDEKVKLFEVRSDNQTIAAALFLVHGDYIHYHLGASDPAVRDARPNNLLFHSVAEWGCDQAFSWLHLGGGRTASPDDGLFRFKASLSHLRLPFYTGRRVHNQEVYETLCSEWMRKAGRDQRPSYFLLYRMEEMNDRTSA